MNDRYIFRKVLENELEIIFNLIQARVKWMDEVGIKQWNVTDYAGVYPMSHYKACFDKDEIFVLEDTKTSEIVCVGVLKSEDERWSTGNDAFYVHHLASKIGEHGVGKLFLECAQKHSKACGKKYLRLDSAIDNPRLSKYYEDLGYKPVGECVDGAYEGILREKEL